MDEARFRPGRKDGFDTEEDEEDDMSPSLRPVREQMHASEGEDEEYQGEAGSSSESDNDSDSSEAAVREFKKRYDDVRAAVASDHAGGYRAWLVRRMMEGRGSVLDRIEYQTPSCFMSSDNPAGRTGGHRAKQPESEAFWAPSNRHARLESTAPVESRMLSAQAADQVAARAGPAAALGAPLHPRPHPGAERIHGQDRAGHRALRPPSRCLHRRPGNHQHQARAHGRETANRRGPALVRGRQRGRQRHPPSLKPCVLTRLDTTCGTCGHDPGRENTGANVVRGR
ncbi:hypothetical protein T484DRAFT_1898949 [Baffinella frigidus]|nr:hypothetical protein T484DRAFT_1898949 [Cryptophyta sp. CCMP2293]